MGLGNLILLGFISFFLNFAESNGFRCQQCRLVRDKEEILKLASEEKAMSEKASVAISSGRIL